ncbi:glycosyltransferase [bacterium]|nr:glycosyltransferase [bacterium]
MQLTILIPTIGRHQKLERCVNAWIRAITHAQAETSVQLLIADNQSTDATQAFATTMAMAYPYIRYQRQAVFCSSAETSILSAAQWVTTPYVWTFGDDDVVSEQALVWLLPFLSQSPDLIFLNTSCWANDRSIPSFDVSPGSVHFRFGVSCFHDFGFTSSTTCISSICVPTAFYRSGILQELIATSTIYSLSTALFIWSHQKQVVVIGDTFYDYYFNKTEDELTTIGGLALKQGYLQYHFWHEGLVALLKKVSQKTHVSLSSLLLFREGTTTGLDNQNPLSRVYIPLIHFLSVQIENELKTLYQSNVGRLSKLNHLIDTMHGIYHAIGELGQPELFAQVIQYLKKLSRHIHQLERYNRFARFYLPFFHSSHHSISYYTSCWLQQSQSEHQLAYHRVLKSYQSLP